MKINQVTDIREAEIRAELFNHTICTVLGSSLYGLVFLGIIGVGTIIPSLAIPLYLIYGGIGGGLGAMAINVLKTDIKENKKYKKNQMKFHEHFPLYKYEYEKRPRYQIDREKGCKVEDFYKEPSSYPTNFGYEKEEKDVTLSKKYR